MRNTWTERMKAETPEAEAYLDGVEKYEPTDGESDINQMAADLLADPDPSLDPYQNGTIT